MLVQEQVEFCLFLNLFKRGNKNEKTSYRCFCPKQFFCFCKRVSCISVKHRNNLSIILNMHRGPKRWPAFTLFATIRFMIAVRPASSDAAGGRGAFSLIEGNEIHDIC